MESWIFNTKVILDVKTLKTQTKGMTFTANMVWQAVESEKLERQWMATLTKDNYKTLD